MVIQDPVMSLGGLLVAPPALLFQRKVIPRIRGIAQMQFTVGLCIIETLQEALQGILPVLNSAFMSISATGRRPFYG